MGERAWADRRASVDLLDKHEIDVRDEAGRWPDEDDADVHGGQFDGADGDGAEEDDAGVLETRPLPALRALPGDTKNGLLALPPPSHAQRRLAAWAAALTWHVPAALPSLDMEPTRLQRIAVPVRPRRVVSPEVRAFCAAPTDKHRALARPLPHGGLLIAGSGRSVSLRLYRPRGRPAGGLSAVVVACALLLAAAYFSRPVDPSLLNFDGLSADASLSLMQAQAGSVPVLGSGGAAAPGVHAPGTAAKPAYGTPAKPSAPAAAPAPQIPASAISAAPFSPWPPRNEWMWVPGYTPYGVTEPRPDSYAVAFGQCTWWAQHERPDENLRNMGNARYWAAGALGRGYHVGTAPARGATAVFQPGVQGAGWAGHVAHVLILYPGGWFLVSEMNAYGNGGGWGRVSFRYAHVGPGVSFIY
jgi:hypothetical protein